MLYENYPLLYRHSAKYQDPVPVATAIRNTFGTTIISIGIPGINGLLQPVDIIVRAIFKNYFQIY
jgi:hypothetical protein